MVQQGKKLSDSTVQPEACKLLKYMFDRSAVLNAIIHAKHRLALSEHVNLSMGNM